MDEYPLIRLVASGMRVHIIQFDAPEEEATWDVAYCGETVEDASTTISTAAFLVADACVECFYLFGRYQREEG